MRMGNDVGAFLGVDTGVSTTTLFLSSHSPDRSVTAGLAKRVVAIGRPEGDGLRVPCCSCSRVDRSAIASAIELRVIDSDESRRRWATAGRSMYNRCRRPTAVM